LERVFGLHFVRRRPRVWLVLKESKKNHCHRVFANPIMKLQLLLPALLVAACGHALAAPNSTNPASVNRILIIDPSSMPVAAGKAVLTIGELRRSNGVYSGDYKMAVFPYFFRSEEGKLAIKVSDECLAKANEGKVVAVVGTATKNGKGGVCRHVDVTATPADCNHGMLKLWFMAGDRKMTFEPAYHFAEKRTAAVLRHPVETSLTSSFPLNPSTTRLHSDEIVGAN
jgi:hypothetical protein